VSKRQGAHLRTQPHITPAPAAGLLQRACACGTQTSGGGECESCKQRRLQRYGTEPAPGVAPPIVHEVLRTAGQPLAPATRAALEPRFGHDFSRVRVHTDAQAAQSARAVNALAYTVGSHVAFSSGQYAPGTPAGDRLIAHELAHVVQQRNAPAGVQAKLAIDAPQSAAEQEAEGAARSISSLREISASVSAQPFALMRRIAPEDVSSEMVGAHMRVTEPFIAGAITLSPGDLVVVVSWSNSATTAQVRLPAPLLGVGTSFDIPKRMLRSIDSGVAGIAPYSAGVDAAVRDLDRGQQRIDAERARAGGPRPGEIPRLEGLQRNRERLLNRRLIQEEMFNRFDPSIRRWVDHYNSQFGFTGPQALDANLVKSMLFQESQMGTAGQHLEDPPRVHFRSRFNVGQVIDSAAAALLIMINEMEPGLIATYHLQNIERDRVAAQADLARLAGLTTRTPAQDTRLTELRAIETNARTLGLSFAETFMWMYRAPGQSRGFDEAVLDFFAVGGGATPRHLDYDFWIRTAIRWLFEKRASVSSWAEAIRAYNGSGARARHYRDAVRGRAQSSADAERSGTPFTPGGI
jgi:hypothetical protein